MKALNQYLIRRFAMWLLIVLAGFGAVAVLAAAVTHLHLLRFKSHENNA